MHQLPFRCVEAQETFTRLVNVLKERSITFNVEVADEICERLEFMYFAISELAKLAAEHMEQHAIKVENIRKGIFDLTFPPRPEPWFFKTKYHTEALYMHACRVRDAVRHKSGPIPGMSSFEAAGVRDVRNHLLFHPEGNGSQIFSQSFLWTHDSGPVIKPRRSASEGGRHEDRGLVHNMTEYFVNFTQVAGRAEPHAA